MANVIAFASIKYTPTLNLGYFAGVQNVGIQPVDK